MSKKKEEVSIDDLDKVVGGIKSNILDSIDNDEEGELAAGYSKNNTYSKSGYTKGGTYTKGISVVNEEDDIRNNTGV
jgi:hypothetical protein